MSSSESPLKVFVPWFFTVVAAAGAVSGWYVAIGARARAKRSAARLLEGQNCQAQASDKGSESAPTPPPAMRVGSSGAQKVSVARCMADYKVQAAIRARANKIAAGLSEKKVEAYKEEEKGRRSERYHKRMDNFETGAVNAANRFIEEKGLDEEVGKKIHALIEDGFEKSRKMFQAVQEGKMTRSEARVERRKQWKAGQEALVALLGEDGAASYWEFVRDEMKKQYEKRAAEEEKAAAAAKAAKKE